MTQFTQLADTRLFTSNSTAGSGFLGFYLTEPEITRASLSLEELWDLPSQKGYLVFVQQAPADLKALATAIDQYRTLYPNKLAAPGHTSLAWIDFSETQEISQVHAIKLKANENATEVFVAEDVHIRLDPYGIPFATGEPVILQLGETATETILFQYRPVIGGPPPVAPFQRSVPLTGPSGGSLRCQVSIGEQANSPLPGNIGINYFYTKHEQIQQLCYPLFELKTGDQLWLDMQLDPLMPLDATRTFFRFKEFMFRIQLDPTTGQPYLSLGELPDHLPSTLRTMYGHPIYLVPDVSSSDHSPSLVLQPLPTGTGTKKYYLAPAGDFFLAVKQGSGSTQLMAGLMGTESISFTPYTATGQGDKIRFTPNCAAYAPVFPLSNLKGSPSQQGDCPSGELLCDTYVTSWVSFLPGAESAPEYFAQPESSPLFLPILAQNAAEPGGLSILESFPAQAAKFDAGNQPVFPLVGYSGAVMPGTTTATALLKEFELGILNPSRRKKIATKQNIIPANGNGKQTVTSPQGFLVTIENGDWNSVQLARNTSGTKVLAFEGHPVAADIREALQSNQLFAVITLGSTLGGFMNEIDIDGWPFSINPQDNGGKYSNVLIFKFCEGNLASRAAQPMTWTKADTFNNNPLGVSEWLLKYFDSATENATNDPNYRNFSELISSDSWNGVIALQVDISLDNFPEDLKGLLGGIAIDRFNGHHFGIQGNYVAPIGGQMTLEKSSLFGLISYYDAAYALANGITTTGSKAADIPKHEDKDGYDFTVLYLQVAFNNSTIVDFNSLVRLSASKWFGEPALSDCTIELIGSREDHNGQPTYSFTTQKNKSYQFYIDSKVVSYLQIVKARFNSTPDPAVLSIGGNQVTPIRSVFSFWGYLNFNPLEGFDPLSFGEEEATSGSQETGLYFYNLAIEMYLDLEKTSLKPPVYQVSNRAFTFNEENTSFDISLSKAHKQSLYPNFPLSLTAMVSSRSGSLEELGYLPLSLPNEASFAPLGNDWYGLEFTLNLGSMGALASLAGFNAKMMIAWSASKGKPSIGLAIRLPGGGGASGFSFENVLQLSIGSMALEIIKPDEKTTVYALRLRTIALNLLGQSLPKGGSTDLVLYGNPQAQGQIGWYGQYAKK